MISAKELLAEFELEAGLDHTTANEQIAYLYAGIRLTPIVGKYNITPDEYDEICESIVNQYLEEGISLDSLINAVYNYINKYKKSPLEILLNSNISEFLEDFANNEEY